MTDEILINVTPQETRVAVIGSGQVQELIVERTASRGLVGNICMGRVARVLPGIQAAFVEIGLERAAFLHAADIWEHRRPTGDASRPIERILVEGQPLLVQVIKDPIGSKGARLSTQVSIAGRMLVYLPHDSHIGISQRIEDETGRQLLRDRLRELLPGDEKGGFILRTLAESATEDELRADIEYLRHLWRDIGERALHAQAPALVYQDLSLAQRVLRDMASADTARVLVDSRENFQKLAAFADAYTPNVRAKLEHYTGERPLFDLYNVEPEIEKALSRRVDLKSGGYLIVDQTEAMTTIDVNTGGFVGAGDRAPAAPAQPRRHHRARFHRHGVRGAPFGGSGRVPACARARPHADDRERLHRARAGRDDPQAHARVAGARAVRALPDLLGARRGENRAHRLLRNPARDPARGAPVQRARIPRARLAIGGRPAAGGRIARGRDAVGFHWAHGVAAGRVELYAGSIRHRADVTHERIRTLLH